MVYGVWCMGGGYGYGVAMRSSSQTQLSDADRFFKSYCTKQVLHKPHRSCPLARVLLSSSSQACTDGMGGWRPMQALNPF